MKLFTVSAKDFIYSDLTCSEKGRLIELLAHIAVAERELSREEIIKIIPENTLKTIEEKLEKCSKPLSKYVESIVKVCPKLVQSLPKVFEENQQIQALQRKKIEKKLEGGKNKSQDALQETEARVKRPPATVQAEFIESWAKLYESEVVSKFKIGREDYVIASKLITDFGIIACAEKARIFYTLCKMKSAWFSRGGMGDFTVRNLIKHWNEITEGRNDFENKFGKRDCGITNSDLGKFIIYSENSQEEEYIHD